MVRLLLAVLVFDEDGLVIATEKSALHFLSGGNQCSLVRALGLVLNLASLFVSLGDDSVRHAQYDAKEV